MNEELVVIAQHEEFKVDLAERLTIIALENQMFRHCDGAEYFAKEVITFYNTIYSELGKED